MDRVSVQMITLIVYVLAVVILAVCVRLGLRWQYAVTPGVYLASGISFYVLVLFSERFGYYFHAATWSAILRLHGALSVMMTLTLIMIELRKQRL